MTDFLSTTDSERIYSLVQEYLKPSPLIVWGSGGTIPYDIPSMDQLKTKLGIKSEKNLENFLAEIKNEKKLQCYKEGIFNLINEADAKLRENINCLSKQEAFELLHHFYDTSQNHLDIVTTNYDCFLEYLFSYRGLPYTDGFSGKEFSKFNQSLFGDKEIINVIKVHGSLRWNEEGRYSYYNKSMKAVYPSEDKYKESLESPFRELIQLSDQKISKASSFLVIGFGFNDEHLTPKIKESLSEKNNPIVLVTEHATESAKKMVHLSDKFVLIEKKCSTEKQTEITYKDDGKIKNSLVEGECWKLKEFVTMFTNSNRG